MLPPPPRTAKNGRGWNFGRYVEPIPEPDVAAPGLLGRFRLKEWAYAALTTERWFVACAMAQLGYVANGFAYVVDRRAPAQPRVYEALSPLGRALTFAPSSVRGETRWRRGRDAMSIAWSGGWEVTLDLGLGGERLEGGFRVWPREALALLHELPGGRPAYTHKAAGLPASGTLRFGGETIDGSRGLGSLDWTRSAALRDTRWKWASFSGRDTEGRIVGLNLSAEVYGDDENALWIDGRVVPLNGVRFELPADRAQGVWRIRGAGLELDFQPQGARAQDVDLKLVKSSFVQPYGLFRGHIEAAGQPKIEVRDVFGVVEDHVARW